MILLSWPPNPVMPPNYEAAISISLKRFSWPVKKFWEGVQGLMLLLLAVGPSSIRLISESFCSSIMDLDYFISSSMKLVDLLTYLGGDSPISESASMGKPLM